MIPYFVVVSFVSSSLSSLSLPRASYMLGIARFNLLSKVVRCGASQKKTPRDSTHSTARGVLLLGCAKNDPFSQLICCQKGLDVASIKRLPRMGHTCRYFPFGAMIERSQMTPFHNKLLEVHLIYESLSLWLVTAEVYVELHRMLVTTLLEDLVAELVGHLLREDTLLLEV